MARPNFFSRLGDFLHDRISVSESGWDFLKLLVLVGVLGGIGYGGWRIAQPRWTQWKKEQALDQMKEYVQQGDYRSALISLRRATQSSLSDPVVWREAAKFLTQIGSPESVVAHQNLAWLEPEDISLKIALVTEALRFDKLRIAQQGIDDLEATQRADESFHRLAAALALTLGKLDEFETNLEALIEIAPLDSMHRYNLAALRLWSENKEISAKAYAQLLDLLTKPTVKVRATLECLAYLARQPDRRGIETELTVILYLLDPESQYEQLQSTQPNEPAAWSKLLSVIGQAARSQVEDAQRYATWLSKLNLDSRALEWLASLPSDFQAHPSLSATRAKILAKTDDLDRLREQLKAGAMGPLSNETITLLLASRFQSRRYSPSRATTTWQDAIQSTNAAIAPLKSLAELAVIWKEKQCAIDTLEFIIAHHPRQLWAYEALRLIYGSESDMSKLWTLYQRWAPLVPDNRKVEQTWLMLAAILNRVEKTHLDIAEAWSTNPADRRNPASVIAISGVWWRSGKITPAQALLNQLPDSAQKYPRVHLWRAILASESGLDREFEKSIKQITKENLEPEELQLLTSAQSRINQKIQQAARQRKIDAANQRSDELKGVPQK